MSAVQSNLPGMFPPTAQAARVAALSPDQATLVLANCLITVSQTVGVDPVANTVDRALQGDLRYRTAMAQAITVSLGLNDQSRRHANDRCAFLAKHLRDRGPTGIAGKLARVALILGYAAQDSVQPADLAEAFQLLDQAIALHAILHSRDVGVARSAAQMSFLNATQPHRLH